MKINFHKLQKSSLSWSNEGREWRDNKNPVNAVIPIIWPLHERKSLTNCCRSWDQVAAQLIPPPAPKSVVTLLRSRSASARRHSRLAPALRKLPMSGSERMNKWEEPRFPFVRSPSVESAAGQNKSCGFLHLLHAAGSIGLVPLQLIAALLLFGCCFFFLLNFLCSYFIDDSQTFTSSKQVFTVSKLRS